jgi:hypothetical protein
MPDLLFVIAEVHSSLKSQHHMKEMKIGGRAASVIWDFLSTIFIALKLRPIDSSFN